MRYKNIRGQGLFAGIDVLGAGCYLVIGQRIKQ